MCAGQRGDQLPSFVNQNWEDLKLYIQEQWLLSGQKYEYFKYRHYGKLIVLIPKTKNIHCNGLKYKMKLNVKGNCFKGKYFNATTCFIRLRLIFELICINMLFTLTLLLCRLFPPLIMSK